MATKNWSDIRSQKFTPQELGQIDQDVQREILEMDLRMSNPWTIPETMAKADLARLALELPMEEQLDPAQPLLDQASPPAHFTLTPELKELLEARLREAQADPDAGIIWEDMKARLLKAQ